MLEYILYRTSQTFPLGNSQLSFTQANIFTTLDIEVHKLRIRIKTFAINYEENSFENNSLLRLVKLYEYNFTMYRR